MKKVFKAVQFELCCVNPLAWMQQPTFGCFGLRASVAATLIFNYWSSEKKQPSLLETVEPDFRWKPEIRRWPCLFLIAFKLKWLFLSLFVVRTRFVARSNYTYSAFVSFEQKKNVCYITSSIFDDRVALERENISAGKIAILSLHSLFHVRSFAHAHTHTHTHTRTHVHTLFSQWQYLSNMCLPIRII